MKLFPMLAAALLASSTSAQGPAQTDQSERNGHTLDTVQRIPELMDAFGVSGMAVAAVSGDTVLVTGGFGTTQEGEAYASTTPCGLFSATKVLASLAYTKLDSEGVLRLDQPLGSYIDEAPRDWRNIPFFRLLNHSSGITMAVNKGGFEALSGNPAATNAQVYEMLRGQPLDYRPGEFSRYRQSGYAVAEMILQDRHGLGFDELVEEHIARPAGLNSTRHPSVSDASRPSLLLSAGGYETNAEDMAKLFKALNAGDVIDPLIWKSQLLDERYLFDDYSLGSVIEERDGVLTVGHSGGGARANIRYAPDKGVGVMVCTDDRSNKWLAITLARMLIAEIVTGETPKLPMWVALKGHSQMSSDQIIAAFKTAKEQPQTYDISDAEMIFNEIGYGFLGDEQTADAVAILGFNAQLFPDSPNAHDSYGEALLTAGDIEGALSSYRTVLKLDPGNENAEKMIAGILREASNS